MKKLSIIFILSYLLYGCSSYTGNKYNIYSSHDEELMYNSKGLVVPQDIRLADRSPAFYRIEQSNEIPKAVPSILPPGSLLVQPKQ